MEERGEINLNIDTTKRYLTARRNKVKELWNLGYTVDEIARYFEVWPESIDMSLVKCNINQFDRQINCSEPKNFTLIMRRRDGLQDSGFIREPLFYKNTNGNVVLEELLCGFKGRRIAQTLGCPSGDVLKISTDPVYSNRIKQSRTEREKFANELLEIADDWSMDEISEFTGVPKSRVCELENAPKKRRVSKKAPGTLSYKKENIAVQIAEQFLSGNTQQSIADEFGLSRATVSKYLRIVGAQDPQKDVLIKDKLKNHGADIVDSKNHFREQYSGSDEVLAILQQKYVQDGCLIQTQRSIARELGVSEQIIQRISKTNGFIPFKKCR